MAKVHLYIPCGLDHIYADAPLRFNFVHPHPLYLVKMCRCTQLTKKNAKSTNENNEKSNMPPTTSFSNSKLIGK